RLRPDLAPAAHHVFVGGQLFGADGAAGVQFRGRDADLAAEAEFAAVGELGRGVDQDDGAVHAVGEAFGGIGVGGDDRLGVARAVSPDVLDGALHPVHDPHRQDGGQVFGGPVGLRRL